MNLAPASSSGGFMGIGRDIDHERLDDLRRGRGPVQEHVIDEFVAGRLSRRDFIRKGSAIGLSMPLLGGILAACGSSGTSTSGSSSSAAGKAGATIKEGSFVDAVSEDNYNMIIVPNNYDYGKYQTEFPGTGRFMKSSYTPNVGATYVRNPHYWGKKALPSQIDFTFYPDEAPMAAALSA